MTHYLALDVGTHAVRAALINSEGNMVAVESCEVGLQRIDANRVEQNPDEILSASLNTIERVIHQQTVPIESMGLAVQRSTVVAWHRVSGKALSPAISWQDTRGSAQVAALANRAQEIQARSGLILSPHYGASKIAHLQDTLAEQADTMVTPLVSYLLFHLLEGSPCLCDESNAGRTQLWHLHNRCWDQTLLRLFGVTEQVLPKVLPVMADYGYLKGKQLAGKRIALRAVAGDQNAALNALLEPSRTNVALANLGSGAFVLKYLAPQKAFSLAQSALPASAADLGLLQGLGYSTQANAFPIAEGTVNGAGTAISWFCRQQGWGPIDEHHFFASLNAWYQEFNQIRDPCLFLNAVGGVGSPFWRTDLESRFTKVPLSLAEAACALVDSIVFYLYKNIEQLHKLDSGTDTLLLTGGLARCEPLCQRLALLSGLNVYKPDAREATAYGVARLASGLTLPSLAYECDRFARASCDKAALASRYHQTLALLNENHDT